MPHGCDFGVKNSNVGICDGALSTARSSCCFSPNQYNRTEYLNGTILKSAADAQTDLRLYFCIQQSRIFLRRVPMFSKYLHHVPYFVYAM